MSHSPLICQDCSTETDLRALKRSTVGTAPDVNLQCPDCGSTSIRL